MKKRAELVPNNLVAALTIAILLVALSSSYYIWIPDIVRWGEFRTVAQSRDQDGNRYVVSQAWTSDFYATILTHIDEKNGTSSFVIDPDGDKLWSSDLKFEKNGAILTITHAPLFGPPTNLCTYDQESGEFRAGERGFVRSRLSSGTSTIINGNLVIK